VDSLGRNGDGPGEYRSPTLGLVRHGKPGVLDPMQHRITVWNDDGTLDTATSVLDIVSFELNMDTLGNLYAEQLPSNAGFTIQGQEIDSLGPKDSIWIYRMHPPDPGRDTVAQLHDIGWEVIRLKGGGMSRMRRLYASPDQWGVLPDGSLWVLRGEQNRVDRRSPDGRWIMGAPREWTEIATTAADREMLTGRFVATGDTVWRPMADVKGPFQDDAVAAPDGAVWAQLNTVAGDSVARYEIFPATGPSTRTVVLPRDWKVVAVTGRHVYAVHEDEEGFKVIERMGRMGRLGGMGE
jgi:predicted RNA binding protein YcfA (HicA-like mRNA interferase family)